MSQEAAGEQERASGGAAESPRDQIFNQFYDATDFQEILASFRALCEEIGVDPCKRDGFYVSLKRELTAWKCRALWQLLDSRASLPEYESQKACEGKRVLVIGAGPVGMRAAIEAALLGARVDVVEKRTGFSRNNSLHLWPFLITDLRTLGAKKFYGRFCSGAIDHICIRILQSILLKVCLLLGVQVHPAVTFTGLLEPKNANSGWSVATTPTSSPVSSRHYDAIFGADGKQNSLPGFRSKEFRAKLALAITANFVNSGSKPEASVPEISGVAYVYNQDFFNTLAETLGIELENIVYYKDETHYFVMTAKKPSLLKKGVIKKDHNDPKELLSPQNVDRKAPERYAIEAVTFSTDGGLENLPFEKNHRGENDVALFDFTSLFAAENAARIMERKGKKILLCVVGDSLLEPFWPTGTGCARGFLGAFDAAWMLRRFCAGVSPLELLEEREAIYYLLPQTTPERLQKNFAGYTIDPKTRYLSLGECVAPGDISHLYDSDVHPAPPPHSTPTAAAATKPVLVAGGQGSEDAKVVRSRTVGSGWIPRSKSIEGLPQSAPSATELIRGNKPISSANDRSSPAPAKPVSAHSPKPKLKPWGRKEDKSIFSPAKPSTVREAGNRREKQHKSEKDQGKPGSVKAVLTAKEPLPATGPKTAVATGESPSRKVGKQHSPKSKASSEKSGSPRLSWFSSSKKAASHEAHKKHETASSATPAAEPESKHLQSVAEIVKQLDQPPPTGGGRGATAASSAAGKKKETSKHKSGKKDEKEKVEPKKSSGKAAANPKSEKKEREKEREREREREKERKRERERERERERAVGGDEKGKEAGKAKDSAHWWSKLPFLKHKKSYDVAAKEASGLSGSASSPKHKRKSKREEKHPPRAEEPTPPSIHARIEQLKQRGVAADSTDAPGDVIVGETPEEGGVSELRQPVAGRVEPGVPGRAEPGVPEGMEQQVAGDVSEQQSEVVVAESKDIQLDEEKPERVTAVPGQDGSLAVGEGPEARLAAEAEGGVVRSKPESHSVGEEPTSVVEDSIRKLQPFFEAKTAGPSWKTRSSRDRRSKEFDLADLELRIGETKPDTTNPLWMAREIQSLNKHLERLRLDNDVMTAKTALVILNTIFSNVHNYPDDDRYRRLRVSSERFHHKVWQHSEARQFLARAGWVEIDDFVVLPIGKKVNIPMRVLSKHLDMMWSQQLELPDSPQVLRKMKEARFRGKSASLNRKESYATRVVNEGIERVEQDRVAMAAARMKQMASGGGGVAVPLLAPLEEAEEGTREDSPDPAQLSAVRKDREEEVVTMKAASAARDIWSQRDRKDSTVARQEDREYKLILDSELYDFAPRKVQTGPVKDRETVGRKPEEEEPLPELAKEAAEEGSKLLVEGTRRSQSPRTPPPSDDDVPSVSGSDAVVRRSPRHELSSPEDPAGAEARSQRRLSQQEMLEAAVVASESARQVWLQKIDGPDTATTPPSTSKEPSPSPPSTEDAVSPSTSPTQQLNAEAPSSPPRTHTPVTASAATVSSDGRVESPVADAQSATLSSIRSDIIEYEKMAMESAAQVRQKWMEAEASAISCEQAPSEASSSPPLEEEATPKQSKSQTVTSEHEL